MNCHLEFFVHRVDSIEAEDPGGDCWNQGQTFACLAQRHTFLGGDTLQCSAKSVALRCTLCACTAFQQCVLVCTALQQCVRPLRDFEGRSIPGPIPDPGH